MRLQKKISIILSFLLVFSILIIDFADISLAKNVMQDGVGMEESDNPDIDSSAEMESVQGTETPPIDALEVESTEVSEKSKEEAEEVELKVTEGTEIQHLGKLEGGELELKKKDNTTVVEVSDLDSFIQAILEESSDDELESQVVFMAEEDILDEGEDIGSEKDFSNKRLIVISKQGFDTYGAISVIQGYHDIFVLSYESEEATKVAFEMLSTIPELIVEVDAVFETSELDTVEEIKTLLDGQDVKTEEVSLKGLQTAFTEMPTSGKEIKVAVLDTGYDYELCDAKKLAEGIDISGTGTMQDIHGHGTSMVNIIRDNSSEDVKVMPIKIADANGRTSVTKLYLGVMYAMEHEVDIINISMNAYKSENATLLNNAINQAREKGIFVVVSAGNSSDDVINYAPADNENAIVVSAINTDGTIMEYSNFGTTVDFSTYGKVMTTGIGNEQIEATGTSVSSAIMSMQIAQLLLMNHDITYDEVMRRLVESAEDLGEAGRDNIFGHGAVTPEIINAIYDSNICETAEIFTVDWKNISDEELNRIIEDTNEINLVKFVKDLQGEDREALLAKNTKLNKGYVVAEGKMNGEVFSQTEYDSFYEYLMENDVSTSWYAPDGASQKGYFNIQSPSGFCKVDVSYKDLKTTNDDKDSTSTTVSYTKTLTSISTGGATNFDLSDFKVTTGTDSFHVYLGMHVKFDVDTHSKLTASASLGSGTNGAGITTFGGSYGSSVSCTKSNTVWGNSSGETTGCQVAFNETGISIDGGKAHNATVQINMSGNSTKESSKAPTCTIEGYDKYSCSKCSTSWKTTRAALGHYWNESWNYETNNGIGNGYRYEHCARNCNESGWTRRPQFLQQIFYRFMDVDGNYGGYNVPVNGYYDAGTGVPGWYLGETYEYFAAGIGAYISSNANQLYYDVARKKYHVAFHGNGATGGSTPSHNYVCVGKQYYLNRNGFERKFSMVFNGNGGNADGAGGDKIQRNSTVNVDSIFLHWSTGSAVYGNGALVSNLSLANDSTVTMYAQWSDKTVKLPVGAREGHHFLGWSTNPNAKTPDSGYEIGKSIQVSENKKLYAVWKIITYPVIYHSNDGTNQEISELKTWGQPYTVKDNPFVRDGYDFAGWSTNPDLNIADGDPEYKPKDIYSQNADLTLYAVWAQRFNVAYIGNEQTLGDDFVDSGNETAGISQLDEYTFNGNENELKEKIFTKNLTASYTDEETGEEVEQEITSTVVSWSLLKNNSNMDSADRLDESVNCGLDNIESAATFYDRANKKSAISVGSPNEDFGKYPFLDTANFLLSEEVREKEKNLLSRALKGENKGILRTGAPNIPYINLYAVWDDGPLVKSYDLYYTLQFAQSTTGTKGITFDELLSKVEVTDQEDEHIEKVYEFPAEEDRAEKTTYVTVVGYSAEDFTGFTSDGSVSVTFQAIDSVGNITEKMIYVHVADASPQKVSHREYTRFINERYYGVPHEQGGLEEKSLWLTDNEYVNTIQAAFQNGANDTPEETYQFTREEVLQMQEYVKQNGIGNSVNPDALTRFYETFMR